MSVSLFLELFRSKFSEYPEVERPVPFKLSFLRRTPPSTPEKVLEQEVSRGHRETTLESKEQYCLHSIDLLINPFIVGN